MVSAGAANEDDVDDTVDDAVDDAVDVVDVHSSPCDGLSSPLLDLPVNDTRANELASNWENIQLLTLPHRFRDGFSVVVDEDVDEAVDEDADDESDDDDKRAAVSNDSRLFPVRRSSSAQGAWPSIESGIGAIHDVGMGNQRAGRH